MAGICCTGHVLFTLLAEVGQVGDCVGVEVCGRTGEFQSGQMGQTVNLVAYAFAGSNPASPSQNVAAFGRGLRILIRSRMVSLTELGF